MLGAVGFITPSSTAEEIVATVRRALVGDHEPIPRRRGQTAGSAGLSERERELLALLCTGATNRKIAEAVSVGTETVKKHAHALYLKARRPRPHRGGPEGRRAGRGLT